MSWRPQPKGSRKPEKRRFQNKGLCFFAPFSGLPLSGKQCLCGHKWHKGGLLGLAPNPYLRANMARSVSVALLLIFITLTLLFLLSSRLGVAHQSVNVRLDRDDLLHIPSCLLVFSIELFFLCCELTAFFLQHVHFGELRPTQRMGSRAFSSSVTPAASIIRGSMASIRSRAARSISNRCGYSFSPKIRLLQRSDDVPSSSIAFI